MSERLEAARGELRGALAVARASLAQVRGRPGSSTGPDPGDTDRDHESVLATPDGEQAPAAAFGLPPVTGASPAPGSPGSP